MPPFFIKIGSKAACGFCKKTCMRRKRVFLNWKKKWGKTMKMSEKENYLKTLRGEHPDWVPLYSFGPIPGRAKPCTSAMVGPDFLNQHMMNGGGKDIWGVNYVATYETGNALLPEPGNFILDDITKWHDVIKAPSLEGIDWEAMANRGLKGLADRGFKREESALALNMHVGYFQNLMAFMGFTEGLCAMSEEPEEVYALFDYMCDFYTEVTRRIWPYIKPDVVGLTDDTAAWGGPFISAKMYHDLVLPFHDRQAKFARDENLCITMHNCGKCEGIMEDLVGIGVNAWEPAQTCNDLKAVQEKFGNKLVLMGCWDARDRLIAPDVTEEEIRQSVRDTIDTYAPGGSYCFCGGYIGPFGDKETKRKNDILADEVYTYGAHFYDK